MDNNREIGDNFEKEVVHSIINAKRTVNSGATFDDCDISHPNFVIECKIRNTKGVSVPATLLAKVKKQADKVSKDFIIINKTLSGTFATIKFDTLAILLDKEELFRHQKPDSIDPYD